MRLPEAKQLPSGAWRVQVTVDGKRVSVTRDGKTEAENAALVLKFSQPDTPSSAKKDVAKTLTVTGAIDMYIQDMKGALSVSTVRSYRIMQKYRFKSIMNMPLSSNINWQLVISEETKCHVVRVYKDRIIETNKLLSAKTIKNAWTLIEAVLVYFKQPVPEDLRLPMVVPTEHAFLEPDEIRIFLKAIEEHRYELPYLLCLHGLRRSEMLAVTKADIIMPKSKDKKPYIHVRGAMVYDENNKLVEKETNKTQKSTREVPIFIPRLLELVKQMPDGKLCNASPSSMTNPLNVVLRNNDLPETGLHGLRHTFVSLCYHLRIPTLVTKKWGGYAPKSTVVEHIYTHLARKDEAESVTKMEMFYKDFV